MATDIESFQEVPGPIAFELAESNSKQPKAAKKVDVENGSQAQAKQDSSSKNDVERSLGHGGSRLGGNFF